MKESGADALDSSDDDDNQQPLGQHHQIGSHVQPHTTEQANRTAQTKANRLDLLLKVS